MPVYRLTERFAVGTTQPAGSGTGEPRRYSFTNLWARRLQVRLDTLTACAGTNVELRISGSH